MDPIAPRQLRIFSTAPESRGHSPETYAGSVLDAARWSEAAGCEGMLLYTDNGLLDPWLVAGLVAAGTDRLAPLVAVQPAYMHPYAVAKMVTSLAFLYGRRVHLNLVAGGFRNDLLALGDETPHDRRYERLAEFAQLLGGLLGGESVTRAGEYYSVSRLSLAPALPDELRPSLFISGSSPAGARAATQVGAVAISYPRRADEEQPRADGPQGLRVGVIARADSGQAWSVARERFPADRRGQIAHGLAQRVSDSHWHRQLSEMGERSQAEDDPYWLFPFENYATFCPYLVGSYERVAAELRRYIELGFSYLILDVPASREELEHTAVAIERAMAPAP